MRTFLGIDSGTQSTKVILLAEDGSVVGRGHAAHELIADLPPGAKEQHPRQWIDALIAATREAIATARIDPSSIVAIAVSGQQHGFVPLDATGKVIRPAKLWCDVSTATEAEEIIAACGGLDALIDKTGNGLPPGFTASKILWLKRYEPENFARLATVLLPHDYLNFWLTGRAAMESGDASGTGFFDVRGRRFQREVMDAIDPTLAEKLPPLLTAGTIVGTLRREAAEALGLALGIPVATGGGDNMMGAIGTGNVEPGVVSISLGTSGTVYAFSDKPIIDRNRGEIAAFCDSTGGWLPLVCTMNVTVATEMVKKTFCLDNVALEVAATAVKPGADGLLLLPYLEGERTPNLPDGTGVWLGYREGAHSAGHFARAAMEGTALGLAYGFAGMRELGIVATEVRLTGGGSRSATWRQIIADVFGVPVVCTEEPEGAALGAAIQAAWSLARRDDPEAAIADLCRRYVRLDEGTRAIPRAENIALYRDLLALQTEATTAMKPIFARAAALRRR